jgi:hypothetical protein
MPEVAKLQGHDDHGGTAVATRQVRQTQNRGVDDDLAKSRIRCCFPDCPINLKLSSEIKDALTTCEQADPYAQSLGRDQ